MARDIAAKIEPSVAELLQCPTLSYEQTHKVFNMSVSQIKRLARRGEFDTFAPGMQNGLVLVDRKSFEAYLDRNRRRGVAS